MKKIKLTKGKFALVDDKDYEFLMQWKWHVNCKGYATRTENYYKPNGERTARAIFMHRIINRTPKGMDTDHRDANRLNNQRRNLRNATRSQNSGNQVSVTGSSKYKGVYFDSETKKWAASITIQRKTTRLGRFSSEKEAALAYDVAAKKLYGEFARTNGVSKCR